MSRHNTHTEDLLRELFSRKQGERVSGDPAVEPETALDCNYHGVPAAVSVLLMSVFA